MHAYLCVPCSAPCGVRLDGGQDAMTHRRRGFGRPVIPDSPLYFQQFQLSRRKGPLPLKRDYFQSRPWRIRYTEFGHMTDIGLCLVLSAGGGPRPYPASNLPTLYLSVRGIPVRLCRRSLPGEVASTRAFASGFLQACIAANTPRSESGIFDLPSATLRLRQAGSGLCPICVS